MPREIPTSPRLGDLRLADDGLDGKVTLLFANSLNIVASFPDWYFAIEYVIDEFPYSDLWDMNNNVIAFAGEDRPPDNHNTQLELQM